ncbi:hypothetical protein EV188_102668 [Actinomycetospora succinea]|uniref:Colicin import membrane protein n=1 Tax=Actinomycetospora succinea TaxID=663603 RepID=A0A4R6VM46_9PSEU|nr:hypothetical protein [Actinomycetospora succinea]TDQ63011.1 hypothetical protein EV188_102668 [Actinomycetospora succinea]
MSPGSDTDTETGEELPTSLEDAADLLYGIGREEFIPVRDAMVKDVRKAGDRELAKDIAALRKPSVAAWVANRLAREYPEEIEGLEELGGSLREAQEKLEGDALRQLSRQRHGLINALVERGRRIAREEAVRLGDPAVRELERTIGAALADPAAARALAGGQLAGGMEAGPGLGEGGISAALGGPASGARAARRDGPSRPTRVRPDRRAPRPAPEPDEDDADELHEDDTDDTDDIRDDQETREREDRERAEQEERERAERERREREERERAEQAARKARERADDLAEQAREASEAADAATGEAEEADATVSDLRARLDAAEEARRAAWERSDTAGRERDTRRREADRAREDADTAERHARTVGART